MSSILDPQLHVVRPKEPKSIFDAKLETAQVIVKPLGIHVIEQQIPFASGVSWMRLRRADNPDVKLETFVCFDALNCRREPDVRLHLDELRCTGGIIHKARAAS